MFELRKSRTKSSKPLRLPPRLLIGRQRGSSRWDYALFKHPTWGIATAQETETTRTGLDQRTETRSWAHWYLNGDAVQGSKPVSYAELVQRTGVKFLPGGGGEFFSVTSHGNASRMFEAFGKGVNWADPDRHALVAVAAS